MDHVANTALKSPFYLEFEIRFGLSMYVGCEIEWREDIALCLCVFAISAADETPMKRI